VDLGLALGKVAVIGTAAFLAVRAPFLALPRLLGATPGDQLGAAFGILATVAKPVLAAAVALALVELAVSHLRFSDRMKMTKEELKREVKEEEGDPLLRGRRKRRHRELARGQARVEVPRADALIVNPTHVAVAVRYRRDEGRAPRVLAKGKGALAEYMRELARTHGIPIVEDIPLARLLHRKVKVGREIPAQTYKAVAAILAFVYRVAARSRTPAGGDK
jgi:flagellar biosynthesis protein FlhB